PPRSTLFPTRRSSDLSPGNTSENVFSKGLVQVDYNYDNRYFAIGSYILESSSRFGANNRSANFYTLGSSWILSNEGFMKDQELRSEEHTSELQSRQNL